jgi:hypothetical protein
MRLKLEVEFNPQTPAIITALVHLIIAIWR